MSTPTEVTSTLDAASVMLKARGLVVGHARPILPAVDMEVRRGELWAIVGRNGSGKTTLLRPLLGLAPRLAGSIHVPGRVSSVPQRSEVDLGVPARVVDLVRGGLDRAMSFLRPWSTWGSVDQVRRALRATDVEALAHRQYATLSEGQKQRVLLARAFVSAPDLMILDEPTAAMDAVAEQEALDLVDRLRQAHGLAVLIVAHHLQVLLPRATHVAMLDPDCAAVRVGPRASVMASPDFLEHAGLSMDPHRGPLGARP